MPCLLVFCFILCCFFVAFPLSCKCVLCFIFTTSFCAAQHSSGRHATPAPATPKSEKVAKNNKSSYNKRQQQQQQLLLWLLKCFNFLSPLFICMRVCVCVYLFRFEIRVYLYLWEFFCLPFSLFATRIGTSGGRSASSSAFALAQITAHNFHITSAHLECVEALSVCLCVSYCVCVRTYPTIASCCRCLAPLASGIRNIAIWKSILLMIAMWHTLAHSDTHKHTQAHTGTHIYASYADLLITSHSPQVTPLNL